MGLADYLRETIDPYNKAGLRNVNNTSRDEYNCLSYALGTYAWTRPYDKYEDRLSEAEYMVLFDGIEYDDCANILLERDAQWILDTFPDKVREVDGEDELMEDENLMAFREYVGETELGEVDTDFHAVIRLGEDWYEKCGGCPPRKIPMEEMWINPIGYYYNSDTAYFAVKE